LTPARTACLAGGRALAGAYAASPAGSGPQRFIQTLHPQRRRPTARFGITAVPVGTVAIEKAATHPDYMRMVS
jgi:hypothetical protein